MMAILRNVVVPGLTLITLAACLYFACTLFAAGEYGGAGCVAALAALIGVFVYFDVRRIVG